MTYEFIHLLLMFFSHTFLSIQPEDVANLSDIASLVPVGGAGGGDGGDDDDDDDDGDDDDGDSQGHGQGHGFSDDDDSGDEDMVVLDPDHPLMRRFQNVLRTQLENQNEKITLELKDLLEVTWLHEQKQNKTKK